MKIYSEKTNKEYKSVDECLAAEKEFDDKLALEKAKRLNLLLNGKRAPQK